MAKRRTAGIQRRERASQEALSRRVGTRRARTLDWRILAIVGFLVVGLVVVVVALVVAAAPNPWAGDIQPLDGRGHVQDGFDCRASPPSCQVASNPYSSAPATSGPHWSSPAQWGVYETPQAESQLIHNLEHGGIVIWYQPTQLSAEQVAALAGLVESQVRTGLGGRFKFILAPWAGEDFGHPIAVTAWRWLLYLDDANLDAVRGFADLHYGRAPENAGGPAPPS